MEVTRRRNTDSRERNTGGRYIDYELFDSLMNAQGLRKHTARVRKMKFSRTTYYEVIDHKRDVTLRVATEFAKAAGTTVSKLFPTQASPRPRAGE